MYVPGRKLAFEYDGLYWHSEEAGRGRGYHLAKTEACEKAGIRLVHVLESEWIQRWTAAESYLSGLVGRGQLCIEASSCKLSRVEPAVARDFIYSFAFPAAQLGSVSLGMIYRGEIVQLASASTTAAGSLVLEALTSRPGYSVVGGPEKLISALASRGKLVYNAPRHIATPVWLSDCRLLRAEPPETFPGLPFHVWDCGKLIFELG